ncbi:6-phosphofructokinase [Proteiniclasticum sp. QWL-01]|uniref:6-phosphofructokinase n=1 Tax=Proteiniclasticum sp. QWL-01 TaxID=3036945 RepID=UPI00220643C6|nr:6-phosphofructokinase [Proteiniclasticum sp. QWL-01]UUM13500.1 6-phosphofructokinase [Clostridiaceae bacterium HFYG-1003]WFF74586.1 6-phosphofructokinase [Proteiniclasticum sp. QWL-01]
MMDEIKRIAIMTGGGDCPGLNAVIRAVTRKAIIENHWEVVGIRNGYNGLYYGNFVDLDLFNTSGILQEGGTILFSSNKDNLFKYQVEENGKTVIKDVSDVGVENLKNAGIDVLFVVGGDGTLTSARDFARKGVKVIAIPKTIDNDLASTDTTFGFSTAVDVATEALDRLHTTAASHHRIMVLEVMGRYAGWIALHAGIAGGADAILIPEIPYNINYVAAKIMRRKEIGKNFSVIVVAEGAKPLDGEMVVQSVVADSPDPIRLGGIGNKVALDLHELCGNESRATILGHLQRGGSPSSADRILSSRYGIAAVELAEKGLFGNMVTLKGTEMSYDSLEHVIGQVTKNVDPNCEMVRAAKSLGIVFGDEEVDVYRVLGDQKVSDRF